MTTSASAATETVAATSIPVTDPTPVPVTVADRPNLHWSESPFALQALPDKPDDVPKDFHECAVVMACIHNFFTRALNSIYKHAPIVAGRGTKQDKMDFVLFSLAWYECLHGHHEGEELWYFPEIEHATGNAGIMKANVEQHEAFHAPLDAFHLYLEELKKDPTSLDSAKFVSLIDAFAPFLIIHLNDEIPTLLELGRRFPNIPIKQLDEAHAKKILGSVSKTFFIPLIFNCHDRAYEGGKFSNIFPPTPPGLQFINKWVLSRKFRGAWRYAPCTSDMELKTSMVTL